MAGELSLSELEVGRQKILSVEIVQAEVGAGGALVAQDAAEAVVPVAGGCLRHYDGRHGHDGHEWSWATHALV